MATEPTESDSLTCVVQVTMPVRMRDDLDALARADAGDGEEPNRSRTVRALIRAEKVRRTKEAR